MVLPGADTQTLTAAHSRDKLSLCSEIIHEHFGPIAGRVAAVLIARGRLSVRDLLYFLSSGPSLGAPADRSTTGFPTPAQGRPRGMASALSARAVAPLSRSATSGSAAPTNPDGSAPGRHPLAEPLGPLRRPLEIHHALMVLVQHNVCWHVRLDAKGAMLNTHQPEDESVGPAGTEYFEINSDEVLARLWFGQYIGIALDVFGFEGQEVVELILRHGKLQVQDILTRLAGVRPQAKGKSKGKQDTTSEPPPGTPPYDPVRYAQLEKLLVILLMRGYVRPSVLSAHISAREKAIAYEREYWTRSGAQGVGGKGTIRTPKLDKEIRAKVRARIQEEDRTSYRETVAGHRLGLTPKSADAKRAAQHAHNNGHSNGLGNGSTKKPKTSSRSTKRKAPELEDNKPELDVDAKEQAVLDQFDIDPDIFLRINYERFNVHIRNETFASAVGDWFNGSPALADLFRTMIAAAEAAIDVDTEQSMADQASNPFSLTALESRLPRHLGQDLAAAFDSKTLRKELGLSSKGRKRRKGADGSASSDIPSSAALREAVKLLINSVDAYHSDRAVAIQVGGSSGSGLSHNATLSIQFTHIARRLKQELLGAVIAEEFGPEARRVWTVLAQHGKLDEKAIKDAALLPLDKTRELCTKMLRATLLQLQEVPKSADRSVMRTIFLYYVDMDRAFGWLLDRWYHTLENLIRRRILQDALSWTIVQRVETAQAANEASGITKDLTLPAVPRKGEPEWSAQLAQGANDTTNFARTLLRDAELAQWQHLQHDRLMLTLAESRLLRDIFVLSHLPS